MSANELNFSNVVGELVKNSIDAQCNVVQVEFNETFDIRVIDDGCGFDDHTMQDIGERQLLLTPALHKNRFRYAQNGKFLLMVTQETAEMFIESIRHNSDVRLYKTIVANESVYKVYETNRNFKDAVVTTAQGSMIVLNKLKFSVGDADQVKKRIINSVVELALINFEVDVSVKDTATQQTLYESYRTKNLFDKFEQFLESQQFFSKIQSVSCEKHDVKVELFICESGTATKAFQFVYFNKLGDRDGKWRKFVYKLCKKRFENDLNAKYPVYLANICVENYLENQLALNLVIDNCIRKCVEQLSQPATSKGLASQKSVSNAAVSNNEVGATSGKGKGPQDGNEDKGVRLGDWIFNNSCEDYEKLNLDRDVYRKKICENWVISLEKPKPKDANDSLKTVLLDRSKIQPDDHLFKKPKPRQPKRTTQKIVTTPKPKKSHAFSQIYKPSQHVEAFNNSSLIRASKKLISQTPKDKRRKHSSKNRYVSPAGPSNQSDTKRLRHRKKTFENVNRLVSQLEVQNSTTGSTLQPVADGHQGKKPFEKVNQLPMQSSNRMDIFAHATLEDLNDNDNVHNHELSEALKAPIRLESKTKNTLDFRWHQQTTNFNLNFSSSVAVRAINNDDDPFMNFLGNDNNIDNNSMMNLFGSPSNDVPATTQTQFASNRHHSGSSVYSETSELRYQHNRNDTVHTQYRRRMYRNFVSDNSLNRNSVSSTEILRNENSRPKSIENSSHSGAVVAPKQKSSVDMLSDNVRQTGWPVTININFGQQK